MACPHAAPVPHWPWNRGGGASARDSRSRGEHRDAHCAAVAGRRRGDAKARRTTAAHRATARAHRDAQNTQALCAAARARCAVAGARCGYARAHHTTARRADASRARRAVVEARRAVHSRSYRHCRCRSVDHRSSHCRGGRTSSLAPDPWRPIAGDLRDSHGCGRGYGCDFDAVAYGYGCGRGSCLTLF